MSARVVGMTFDRETLIGLCEKASVPQEHWRNRDSAIAQRQVGELLMLLRAGCEFNAPREPVTDENTLWIEVHFEGFGWHERFDNDQPLDTDLFYLPTQARLDRVKGRDWY